MERALILSALIMLSSCAPMPGNQLMQGCSRESSLDEVEIIVTTDLVETQKYCTEYAPASQVVLNCLTNGCFIPACAIPFVDAEGVVKKCFVYLWTENDYLLAHETRHCQGYADLLY